MSDVPEVVFVCVHNAGRSQMAAALLDHHARGRVQVRSAGSAPAGEINPAVRAAMSEIGIDLSTAFPKKLAADAVEAADAAALIAASVRWTRGRTARPPRGAGERAARSDRGAGRSRHTS